MAVNDCKECEKSVTTRCSGVECELWFRTACVGLKASIKMLSHKNILFLCDENLEVAKERLKTSNEDQETQKTAAITSKNTQTEAKR
ncbi:hypothetical protein E2C01_101532 [Portunus trituberculatus]|uniref:Zinc finger PHD-type domain-containing protein n=1 Tax=Portunus trituberculatus TaxID=210409 RepID=A0A5B7KK93_PORTR|nr:hypothetical protein [Portunus trituberculatus]